VVPQNSRRSLDSASRATADLNHDHQRPHPHVTDDSGNPPGMNDIAVV
jgi:hypothetical protein